MTPAYARWLAGLLAYSLQAGLVLCAGLLLARACRLRAARLRLAFTQGLLVLALVLPFVPSAGPAEPAGLLVWATPGAAPVSAGRVSAPHAAALVLAGGALLRLALLAQRLLRLRAYRLASSPLTACPALEAARDLVGVSAAIHVCGPIEVPATFGAWRPIVLLPTHFGRLEHAAQKAVLCHELRHVRRQDWLQTVGEEVVLALLWFHPAVWWALRDIRSAREQVVDDDVVRLTGERRVYLETLVSVARHAVRPRQAPVALFLGESLLKGRVESLLKEVTMTKSAMWAGVLAAAAGVSLAGLTAARAFPLAGSAGAKAGAERKVVEKPDPTYPIDAKLKGIEGVVVMDVLITASGEVKDVKVTKGPDELAGPATAAVRRWKYEPGPHDTRATLVVHYKLQKKGNDDKPRP